MKKNFKTFIRLYTSFILLSIISYSCCSDQIIQIQSFAFLRLTELNTQSSPNSSVIKDEFLLQARFTSFDVASNNTNFNLITSAYATSCGYDITYLNELKEDSLVISLDKDFIYDGNIITANSNLTEITEITDNIDFRYDVIYVYFLNDFLDKSQFENQEYTFTLSIETTDGLQFEKQISTILDL